MSLALGARLGPYEIFTRSDLFVLPLAGNAKAFPFLNTPANELGGQFSPDDRRVAYYSEEAGPFQVYVAPFPGAAGPRPTNQEVAPAPSTR